MIKIKNKNGYKSEIINNDEFNKFMKAQSFEDKIKILTVHSENNQKNIKIKNRKNHKSNNIN